MGAFYKSRSADIGGAERFKPRRAFRGRRGGASPARPSEWTRPTFTPIRDGQRESDVKFACRRQGVHRVLQIRWPGSSSCVGGRGRRAHDAAEETVNCCV